MSSDTERFDRWIAHFRLSVPDLRMVTMLEREEDNQRYIVVEYENGLMGPVVSPFRTERSACSPALPCWPTTRPTLG